MQSLSHSSVIHKVALFVGASDHRVPTCDAYLLRSGIYEAVGKFMSHSALHTGVAFPGLSKSVDEYLCTEVVTSVTPFTITIDDNPEMDVSKAKLLII